MENMLFLMGIHDMWVVIAPESTMGAEEEPQENPVVYIYSPTA